MQLGPLYPEIAAKEGNCHSEKMHIMFFTPITVSSLSSDLRSVDSAVFPSSLPIYAKESCMSGWKIFSTFPCRF